ncbi:GAF domain-containing SpoIIE family protein phosphatase [Actinoplanes sp. CA-030573]|uniref:GAF domain-containing SpoIIE family protein phosphatase n=1 Tax=Actinoplanes sp. CA-030573 TaxID=3239898 RepID=UPI003D8FB07C
MASGPALVTAEDPARLRALADTGLGARPDATFDRYAAMVCAALDVPVGLVSLVAAHEEVVPGAAGLDHPYALERRIPLSHSLGHRVVAAGEPVVVGRASDDDRVRTHPALDAFGIGSYAGVPLTDADGRVLGSLAAADHRPREWSDGDLALLTDLAAACSDSLRLRIATRHAAAGYDRSQLLLHASIGLSRTRTVTDVVDEANRMVKGSFDPVDIGVVLLDDHGGLRVSRTDMLPADVTQRWITFSASDPVPAAEAVRTGRLVAFGDPDAIAAGFPSGAADLRRLGWQAIACAPIPGPRRPLGVLTFAWDHPHDIDAGEQAIIAALADYVGQALRRADALDQQSTAAATLQKALLTRLPAVDRLRLTARYLPAHHGDHVGGDWYDAVTLPGGRLAIVMGDVTGHSLEAAAAMSELRSMLRGFLTDPVDEPSALLHRLEHANRVLHADTIASAIVAFLDPAPAGAYRLRWSNAGHPPPLVISPAGTVEDLNGADPLLGAVRRATRADRTRLLPAGSTLVLYTDGLVETRTEPFDLGVARLHELIGRHPGATADDLADLLAGHAETRGHEDDVALLIVGTTGS